MWEFGVLSRYHPHIQPGARLWAPAGPSGGPGSKQAGERPVPLPGLAKGPAGLFSLPARRTGNVAADTEGHPAGHGWKDTVRAEQSLRAPSYQEWPPHAGCGRSQPQCWELGGAAACPASPGLPGPRRVLLRHVWPARPSSVPQVGLARRAVGRPCPHRRQSGCGGHGYLVFWRSSRSQVGSVWPILYSSLESSTL